jgi:hypothetical protein
MSKSEECEMCGYATGRLTKVRDTGQWLCCFCEGTAEFMMLHPRGEPARPLWMVHDHTHKAVCLCANVLLDAIERHRRIHD